MKSRFYFFLLSFLFFTSMLVMSQPQPPENLTATQQIGMHGVFVKLAWTAPSQMAHFNVYKKLGAVSDTGSFHRIYSGIRFPNFNDYFVHPGETLSYYVTTIGFNGESVPSNYAEITLTEGGGGLANVTGTITDENTQLPILGATAAFFPVTGWGMDFHARTDSQGTFNVNVPAGTYYLKTGACGYIREFYDNVQTLQEATPITVTEGTPLNFNIALTPYIPPVTYHLSGYVQDSLGNPLPAEIRVMKVRFNSFFMWVGGGRTDSLGNYSVPVKEGDTVIVYAHTFLREFLPEFWDNKRTMAEADRVAITGDVTGINFVLQHKPVYNNGIAGVVADTNGIGVESFVAALKLDQTTHMHMRKYVVSTDSLGVYSFTNLLPGKYILFTHPKEGYQPTFFRYDGTQTLDWRLADSVMVDETSLITGINFTVLPLELPGEGIIAGKITDNSGSAINAAYVYALNFNGDIAGFAVTDVNGNYIIDGLNAGEYSVATDKIDYNPSQPVTVNIDYSGNLVQNVNAVMTPESVTDVKSTPEVINSYELFQNYPNPFNPSTTIKFSLAEKSNVKITVYNVLGVQVGQVINEVKDAGIHSVSFNGSNLASGVYFYKLEAGNFTATKKFTLLK